MVATPIGNRQDISPRAVEVLRSVDLIAAEDTRHSRPLLRHFGVQTPLLALHDHNEERVLEPLVERLMQGGSLALISDAGTPLISDPGFLLVRACQRHGLRVSPVPGASALVAALSVSGLPTDRFLFFGFPARTRAARVAQLQGLLQETTTLVFYESAHRVVDSLVDMCEVFGGARPAVLARELTKVHETVVRADLKGLCELLSTDPMQRRGEFVLMVAGASKGTEDLAPETARTLQLLCEQLPLKQAAELAAQITGEKKNRLYRLALDWKRQSP